MTHDNSDELDVWLREIGTWTPAEALEMLLGMVQHKTDWGRDSSIALLAKVRQSEDHWRAAMGKAALMGVYGKDLAAFVDAFIEAHPELAAPDGARPEVGGAFVWRFKSAPQFLAEPDEDMEPMVRDLVFPGCVTVLAAPHGIGKSMSTTCLAVALALGGRFRDDVLSAYRVALIDRDNPAPLVKRRLGRWGAHDAYKLHVPDHADIPPLTNKRAWEAFPVEDFDLVILDSIGSATEGVSEREGKETQLYLRNLRNLAARGPAVLALINTTKSAESYKGRGEVGDRVDVLYQVRDITGWTPAAGDCWWMELPEAAESAWQDRARRRRGQAVFRLAFVPSKFRLGMQPEPFAIEIDTSGDRWTLRDVTAALGTEAEAAKQAEAREIRARLEAAERALAAEVRQRPADNPMRPKQAVAFLRDLDPDITRQQARNIVKNPGAPWTLVAHPGRGGGMGLKPRAER